tara:strand:+ start:252 stop:461 length:210 start_codon:yes stop_codon:yes gene_type:complete
MEQIRECGECDLCCRYLSHEVYGQHITPDNPCRFIKNGCSIHPKDLLSVKGINAFGLKEFYQSGCFLKI